MANLEMTLAEVIKKDKPAKKENKAANALTGGNRDRRGFRGGK